MSLNTLPAVQHVRVDAAATDPSVPEFTEDNGEVDLYICPSRLDQILRQYGFNPKQLWEGYKYFANGRYYNLKEYQGLFSTCNFANAIREYHNFGACALKWDSKLDEIFKDVYASAQAYISRHYHPRCTKLKWLIQHYDSPAALAQTPFGQHALEDAETEDADDENAENMFKVKM